MSEKIYRLNEGGLLLYVREDIPTQWKGVCFCMSENIYRLNEGGLLLSEKIRMILLYEYREIYVREDIPTQ